MNTEETKTFQWSNIINIQEHTYTDYLKLSNLERDKFMKFEVKATNLDQQAEIQLQMDGVDTTSMMLSTVKQNSDWQFAEILFKQMKYHCGKPLLLSITEKGPAKHLPIIEYFERNKDYLAEYDYMLLSSMHFKTLLDEDFILFKDIDQENLLNPHATDAIRKVGNIRNLDVYVTHVYPQKDMRMDEMDFIIGKKAWVDVGTVDVFQGITEVGAMVKQMCKMSFPVKRGFIRIKAKQTNND
jgi:hypothetical protein